MQKTNMVLKDGSASPVDVTFSPLQSLPDMDSWSDKSTGVYIGQAKITMSIRRPNKNVTSSRVRVVVDVPQLEAVAPSTATGYTPGPKVAYSHLGTIDIVCPDRGEKAEREDILAFLVGVLQDPALVKAVLDGEMPS